MMSTIQEYEFSFILTNKDVVSIRNPRYLPQCEPGQDSYFLEREMRAFYEIGQIGAPWWFQNFYLIRLWWHRPKHHALAVKSFRAGKAVRVI